MMGFTKREIYEWYIQRTSIMSPELATHFKRVCISPRIKERMEQSKKRVEAGWNWVDLSSVRDAHEFLGNHTNM